jgi:hypothetical protein
MKRDWDVIREVLLEVEELSDDANDRGPNYRGQKVYGMGDEHFPGEAVKSAHAMMLWKAGYIHAINASTMGGDAIISPDLTWQGRDLLDTLRSKPVWERIKKTSNDTGIELTFDTVKMLGTAAVKWVAAQAGIDLG